MKNKGDDLAELIAAGGLASAFIFLIAFNFTNIINTGSQFASVILSHNFRTVAEIRSHYESATARVSPHSRKAVRKEKVRVLIVPGHEPGYGGAEYGTLKERDMTLELAQDLRSSLESDPHYEVFIARDAQSWSPEFSDYFKDEWNDITEWTAASREEFSRLVSVGLVSRSFSAVIHKDAPKDVALRLYGITKWSNENRIDIAIHIHFNDNARPDVTKPGKYAGFSIYVPAAQYGNSTTTKIIADSIFKRLAKHNAVSTMPGESGGIIDEPDLIAIGSNNTADAASMLIEYGYIYEPQFQDATVRSEKIKDMAEDTYDGLQDFFDTDDDDE